MNSTSFTAARKRSAGAVRKLGASVLMMGLALTVSARDGSAPNPIKEQPAASKEPQAANSQTSSPKASHKPRRWLEVGIASWYGTQFQGRKTAAGERFDMNQMTCAHPTLPMGTWLRVTNLKNRKTAYVRVNDRGPVTDGRIVNLSFAAARAVGLAGLGKVKLEAVRESDPGLAQALVAQLQMPAIFEPGL